MKTNKEQELNYFRQVLKVFTIAFAIAFVSFLVIIGYALIQLIS